MKVCVVGLGYIGFPTACVIAHAGHDVVGVDVNKAIVDTLSGGGIHIHTEPGLAELAQEAFTSGHLRFSEVPEAADVFVLAVPTPLITGVGGSPNGPSPTWGSRPRADLSFVEAAAQSVAPYVAAGSLLILESTVPPRTTDRLLRATLESEGIDTAQVLICHAPERVLPGKLVHELVHNDRIVGGLTPEASQAAASFYRTFVKGDVLITDATTAELVKLMENTYRDVNIALANEFALVCEDIGVNAWEAVKLANRHPRVSFLSPGPGVGGHCIAIDPYFVIEVAPEVTPLVAMARTVNAGMPGHVVRLLDELSNGIVLRKVLILGASYKANVGDERESPSLKVAEILKQCGIDVAVHDPHIKRFSCSVEEAARDADALLLLTDHSVYQELDPSRLRKLLAHALVLDARGCLDIAKWQEAGFRVMQLGNGVPSKVVTHA